MEEMLGDLLAHPSTRVESSVVASLEVPDSAKLELLSARSANNGSGARVTGPG